MRGIVTLTTDFSTSDAYVGMMRGVILSVAPDVMVVDLAHDISPHDVFQAAFVLESAYCYFPEGTVHMVIVDPGVGSARRRLAMACGKYRFVGPDNGVFTYLIRKEGLSECVEISEVAAREPGRGVTFEGRDIFAPVAAKLAMGAPLSEIGPTVEKPVELSIPRPRVTETAVEGRVIYIDHFGNCITNIEAADVAPMGDKVTASVGGTPIGQLQSAYSDVRVGDALALINSLDHLELAVNQGNLAKELNLQVGTPVRVTITK